MGQVILTKSILAKLMIAVHALAVNFMHAAELPKVPKGNDERQNQCDGSACPSCRYIAQAQNDDGQAKHTADRWQVCLPKYLKA